MRRASTLAFGFLLGLTAACGDDTTTGGGGSGGSNSGAGPAGGANAGGGGGTNTGGDAAGGANTGGDATGGQAMGGAPANSGDCESSADCGGAACLEITPGGFRACEVTPVEATACLDPKLDECCTTADCKTGTCLVTPLTPYCGGPQPIEQNVCAVDLCENEGDCQGNDSVCIPGPMLGYKVRACVFAQCRQDTDCTAEAGGICAPVDNACCGGTAGLYCVYPSDGCRTSADCTDGYCQPGVDRAACEPGVPICPA